MLDKFWESLGENAAGEWVKQIFGPAFLFWAGGLGMYVLKNGWQDLWQRLSGLQVYEQSALLILVLLLLIFSSLMMKRLSFSILRLLEGYWPWPLRWLAGLFAGLQKWLFERRERRWNELKGKQGTLSFREERELVELEMTIHYFPAHPKDAQPTALGNILHAGETAPTQKYGLDAFACWPRLWLVLPETAREDLSAARQGLIGLVELWAWGVLFVIWAVWSGWAVAVAAAWVWLAIGLLHQSAMAYSDLVESAFDLYRWELYKAARWPLPKSSGEAECAAGQRLSEFLWRGEAEPKVHYQAEESANKAEKG